MLKRASVVQLSGTHTTLLNAAPLIQPMEQREDSLPKVLDSLPSSAKWALQNICQTDDGQRFATALRIGTAIAVSDGSLKASFGTAGFTIEAESKEGSVKGVNMVPGEIKEGDSHCCKLSGLCSIVLVVNAICKLHRISEGSIKVHCDNQRALCSAPVYWVPCCC